MENIKKSVYENLNYYYEKIKNANNDENRIQYATSINFNITSQSSNIEQVALYYEVARNLVGYAFALNDVISIDNKMNEILYKIDHIVLHSENFNAKTVDNYISLVNDIKNFNELNYNEKFVNSKIDKFVNNNLKELPLTEKYEIKQSFSDFQKLSLLNNKNKKIIENTEKEFNKYCVKIR